DLARRLGAAWVGEAGETPPHPLDASVIFAPAGDLVPPALEAVDHGGTVVLAGIHVSDIPAMTYEDHVFHEKVLTSVTAATREDGRAMMRLAAEAGVETEVQTFPLAEANRVLRMVKDSDIRGAAVLRVG
ncbi:MAG: alcohol dehydrogenase, partial [Phycisphaerae bacterium]